VTAWMALLPILLISLILAVRYRAVDGFDVRHGILFAFLSTSYCVLWLVGNWIKFGNPFQFLGAYPNDVVRDAGGQLPFTDRLWAYPKAIAYTIWPILPLSLLALIFEMRPTLDLKRRQR